MDRLENIETFVRVAQTQSFAEAARQLRVAKSVVTSRVKQLEEFVGKPLFHRSTRMVRLTDVGQAFLADCVGLVGRANDVLDQMRGASEGTVIQADGWFSVPCPSRRGSAPWLGG